MSGHSKFANIKHKKEKNDAAKGKIFTMIGRELAVAVKEGGPDPANNFKLAQVVAKAKANNMPNDTIERGIKKAAGDGNSVNYETATYEGYGPSGTAIIVKCLTDNKNRTAANVRAAFGKNGGNMGASGSVSYLFDNKGVIVFAGDDADAIFELLLEADVDVDDVEAEEGTITVYTAPTDLHKAIVALRESGVEEFQVTELEMIPQSEVELSGEDLETFEKLYSVLEDDEDVQKIYTNVDGF